MSRVESMILILICVLLALVSQLVAATVLVPLGDEVKGTENIDTFSGADRVDGIREAFAKWIPMSLIGGGIAIALANEYRRERVAAVRGR